MSIKTTCGEWVKFTESDWGNEEAYYDDFSVTVDGCDIDPTVNDFDATKYPAETKLVVHEGGVYFPDGTEYTLAAFFKRWREKRLSVDILIRVNKINEAAVRVALKSMKGVTVTHG